MGHCSLLRGQGGSLLDKPFKLLFLGQKIRRSGKFPLILWALVVFFTCLLGAAKGGLALGHLLGGVVNLLG